VSEAVRAACIIGWPVDHSRSPIIHNYWLKTYGIAGEYRREAVAPEHLGSFIQSLAASGYVGANVTVPHKEAVLDFAVPDDRANAVGAANTLWIDDGGFLRATNTDVEGFLRNLDDCAPAWDRDLDHAVVIGAGGAARAVIQALFERNVARITLVNRTEDRAMALHRRFGERVQVAPWETMNDLLGATALLINTTTLGMAGTPELPVDVERLPGHAVVADLVYVPLVTPLLRAAQARGLRTADGLGMLLHQAVRGFSLWFGRVPDVTPELRAAVEADLGSNLGSNHGPSAT
jgi:shikimate dehydrogenase